MKSFKIRFLTFFLLVWAHLAFQSAVAGEGLKVLVSIKPVHSIVSALMEGTDGAQLLVPKGKTPFTHRVSDQQRAAIAAADLLIWVGPELESSIAAEVKKAEGKSRVITLLDHPDLKILPHRVDENRRDPYFWMDTRNALILINDFANVLIEMDATRAHLYKRNRSKLIKEISLLDRKLEFGYRGLKGGVGLNYYDTLQYFEQAYALKIGGVLTTSPNDLVKGADLLLMHNKIKRGEYACLFTEMGLPRDNLSLLSEGSEVNIAELDTFGTQFEPGPELYTQLMDYNTTTLKECMAKAHQGEDDGLPELPVEEEISRLEPIEGKFMLIDHLGKLVTDEDLKGKYQLLLFGYTHCPDICPTGMQTLSAALDKLGDKADLVQPYFITVDPERDNAVVMREYVKYFNPRIIGLTGTLSMIEMVAEQYKVKYEKVFEENSDPDKYTMDHTASVFMLAPDGTFMTKFAYGISPKQLTEKILENLP